MRRRGRRRKQPLDDLKRKKKCWKLEKKTRSYCLEGWLWKRLWTCLKTDKVMMIIIIIDATPILPVPTTE
jgi:hypothetical protein